MKNTSNIRYTVGTNVLLNIHTDYLACGSHFQRWKYFGMLLYWPNKSSIHLQLPLIANCAFQNYWLTLIYPYQCNTKLWCVRLLIGEQLYNNSKTFVLFLNYCYKSFTKLKITCHINRQSSTTFLNHCETFLKGVFKWKKSHIIKSWSCRSINSSMSTVTMVTFSTYFIHLHVFCLNDTLISQWIKLINNYYSNHLSF